MLYIIVSVLCNVFARYVNGHGYLFDPPARASMWRPPYNFPTVKNYNDNGLNCGGKWNQLANGGGCGICGDPAQGPFQNEAGGLYAKGIITKTYQAGQNFTVKVQVTANHNGWFEFRLCVNNDVTKRITHDCLNKHLLKTADHDISRMTLSSGSGLKHFILKLPENVVCKQCVLQWKWLTDNNPGSVEEEYYGCSDIAIENTDRHKITLGSIIKSTTMSSREPSTVSSNTCRAIAPNWKGDSTMDAWCNFQCENRRCPSNLALFCTC